MRISDYDQNVHLMPYHHFCEHANGAAPLMSLVMWAAAQTGVAGLRIPDGPTFIESLQLSNAIASHKHRAKLHVLRDRLKRAMRDQKRGLTGSAERVAAHLAARVKYRALHP